jgi:hypothetical protein
MIRWFLLLCTLVSTGVYAADPKISEVRFLQDGTFEFSLTTDPVPEKVVFKVMTSDVVTTETDFWTEVPIISQTLSGSKKWFLRISVPNTGMGFYKVTQMNGELPPSPPIIFSEISSNNSSLLEDEDGEYSDWIELYNHGETDVSLQNWALTDDTREPKKWIFPDISLRPNQLLVIFASGKDRRSSVGELHTSFKISASGETLLLNDAKGTPVDAIRLAALENDTTLGRSKEDLQQWQIFEKESTTPGTPNGTSNEIYVEAPTFSLEPGFHDNPITLDSITFTQNLIIRYSLNGDDPWSEGSDYEGPIKLDKTTTARVIALDANGNRSDETIGTFFIQSQHALAVVSLAAPANNFNIEDGFLYGFGDHMFSSRGTVTANFPYSASNAWRDREIPVSFELFEPDGSRGFQQTLGIKIFGGWGSRGYPQKSLAFFARGKYGKGKVRYPLFPELELDEFESFVLRNSGNDNQSTHQIPPRSEITAFGRRQSNGSYFVNGNYTLMRDAMMQQVAKNLDIDQQAYRPVVVYLNGEYWGIYNLREKLNEHYVASHHGVDANQIDLIEGYGSANSGSSSHYNAMRSYMSGGSLASETRYTKVTEDYLDVSSFTDYHLAVIYFQNFDIGNIKQWRDRNDGKFRWMLYDQDYGFNLWPPEVYLPAMKRDFADYDNMFEFYTNTSGSGTGWPNASGRTLLLRKMLENDGFKTQFINRCADLLNTDFASERVTDIIETMASVIRPEMPNHLTRWSWSSLLKRNHGSPFDEEDSPLNIDQWEKHIEDLKTYALQRPNQLREDLLEHFELKNGTFEIIATVEPPGTGIIKINSITHQSLPTDRAVYFKGIPVNIEAVPHNGHQFRTWANQQSTSSTFTIDNNTANQIQLHAIFD